MTSDTILSKLKSAFEELGDSKDGEEAGPPRGVPMASPRSLKSKDLFRLPFEGTMSGFISFHGSKSAEVEASLTVKQEEEEKEPS